MSGVAIGTLLWNTGAKSRMGHMIQSLSMRTIFFSLLIALFVLFSMTPTAYELRRAGDLQSNRSFELVHNFPTDYNFYLSRIRQGLEGRWTVVEKYTSEPHSGSLIHHMYLSMGQVGRFLRVPWGRAGDVYHTARFVLAVVLLFAIATFCRYTMGPALWGVIAFLLAITASSWPKLVYVEGVARFGGYMAWWSVVDSLQRITFIPHLLAGQALIIVLVVALTRRELVARSPNILFLGVLGFVLGMIFPPGLIFVYAVLGVFVLLHMFVEQRGWRSVLSPWIIPYIGFVCVSAPAIVYLLLMTSIYPWKRLAEFDTIHPLPFDYLEYIKALGPMLPLGLIGLWVAIARKEKTMMVAVGWVVAWIALLIIFKFIPAQSPLRFSEMLPNLPLGILTAYLFLRISSIRSLRYIKDFIVALPFLLIVLGLFHMYSSWLWQKDFVDHKIRAGIPLVPTGSYVMYPLKDFLGAIAYIQDNSTRNAIVLSETTAGNYIPVYGGNTVYVGHDNTVDAEKKKELVRLFFSGRMAVDQARAWLEKEHIAVIFFGPQEKDDLSAQAGGGIADLAVPYPFLIPKYTNSYVTVYAIQ